MKVYLVTEKVDYCGYEVRKTFLNEEYAQKYAKLFGYDIKEEEVVEADIVEEHRYYKIECDCLFSINNTVTVIGRHKYPCQWLECNFEFGTWEITEQGENDVLIGKMIVYSVDDEPIDHEQIIEDGIRNINWVQRGSRRIQVGDNGCWLRSYKSWDELFN